MRKNLLKQSFVFLVFLLLFTGNNITSNNEGIIVKASETASVSYQTHVQKVGWQDYVTDGMIAGTSGQAFRLEGIKIRLDNVAGGIEYSTHVQSIGWQDYVSNDQMSGTSGRALRLEAIKIRLTGEAEQLYDVYYRVHTQSYGWLDWAKNDAPAGTAGYSYRLEAIQIVLVPKYGNAPGSTVKPYYSGPPSVHYQTHVEKIGWQPYVADGKMAGTSGKALRLEAIKIKLENTIGGIEYSTHVQSIGWQSFVSNNQLSGTSGKALRLEAIKIRLTGEAADKFDIYYRVHAQSFGWLDWAKNGQSAGTAGYGYRLEAIEIKLIGKGGLAPGSTLNPFKEYVRNPITGTSAHGINLAVVNNLPESFYYSRYSKMRINSLNYEIRKYDWQESATLIVTVYGEKIEEYYSNSAVVCLAKLYRGDVVVGSSTIYTANLLNGEKFIDDTYFYNLEPGNYTLLLTDYN